MKNIKWVLPLYPRDPGTPVNFAMTVSHKFSGERDFKFTFDSGNVKTCISKLTLRDLGYDTELTEAITTVTSK